MTSIRAHIFKQRKVGEREEVKLRLFYPDGTPMELGSGEGGGGYTPDAAKVLLASRNIAQTHEVSMRAEGEEHLLNYSGTWSLGFTGNRNDYEDGLIVPPGPGIYSVDGFLEISDSGLQGTPIRFVIGAYGQNESTEVVGFQGNVPAFSGMVPFEPRVYFSRVFEVLNEGDQYLYAEVYTNPGGDLGSDGEIAIEAIITRLVALTSS